MKRFVSLILSVCFLFSINTVSYAANIGHLTPEQNICILAFLYLLNNSSTIDSKPA